METTFFLPKKEIMEGYGNIKMDFKKGAGFYTYQNIGPNWKNYDYQILFSGNDGCENIRQELQELHDVPAGYASDSDDQSELDEKKWDPFEKKLFRITYPTVGCFRSISVRSQAWNEKFGMQKFGNTCQRDIVAG